MTEVTPGPVFDNACTLVPEDGGRVAGWVNAGCGVQIGVADAAGDQPYQDLALLRLGKVELLDDQRLPEAFQDRGADLHGAGD